MDLWNFPQIHPITDNERKSELGLLKSETGAEIIA